MLHKIIGDRKGEKYPLNHSLILIKRLYTSTHFETSMLNADGMLKIKTSEFRTLNTDRRLQVEKTNDFFLVDTNDTD